MAFPDPIAQAQVPAFTCPSGTKMYRLDLGTLEADEGWLLRGANTSTLNEKDPRSKRRELIVLAVLIEYQGFGRILFETGCAEDLEVVCIFSSRPKTLATVMVTTETSTAELYTGSNHYAWGAPLTDIFTRTSYKEDQKLPAAITATGSVIKDVKAVIIGHLHLDHAGGLERFMGPDVPIYVHEEEFKHVCWAVATGADLGVYLPGYLSLEKLKWTTFTQEHLGLFPGITLHHSPGHTPGLVCMQVNLEKSGTWIWTTDQIHVTENYHSKHPQGWLARDHSAWARSSRMIERLERLFNAKLIFGHDKTVAAKYMGEKYQE